MSVALPFDVTSRLAEGQPAVDDVDEYVTACHRLGYQHPDLTAHAAQVRDWYASERGLDLRALDGDCAVLSAVASTAEDAARTQAALVAELSAAWSGRGAAAAREFAWRSGQAANTVSTAVRVAADAAATLRDALWRAVDAKVATVEAIDGRHQAQRAQWLAAAKTVTSGAGDVSTASELVDQEVMPFVHDEIGSDWLAAMRAATASIRAAYDAALASTSATRAVFDVPGDLGPRAETPDRSTAAAGAGPSPSAVATVPAAVSSAPVPGASAVMPPSSGQPAGPWPGSALAMAPPPVDPVAQAPAAALPPAAPSVPSMPSLGDLGAGASPLGTGASGFGQQLADLIGGLVGPTDDAGSEAADVEGLEDVDEHDASDELDPSEDDPDEPLPDDESASEGVEDAAEVSEACVGEATAGPAPDPAPAAPEAAPDLVPAPTVVEPAPDSLPPPAMPEPLAETTEPTPCEIAADELPQVGG